MKQQIVIGQYPPNYPAIIEAFPSARRSGVIFSYGDKIYAPKASAENITEHLRAHEAVHGERQIKMGVERWWHMYIIDVKFRYQEELLAHRAEYLSMTYGANRNQRRAALKMIAGRLASPLYGVGGGWKKAADDILKGIEE